MPHKILLTDILILKTIFFNETSSIVVFDKEGKLNINTVYKVIYCTSIQRLKEIISTLEADYVLVNFSANEIDAYQQDKNLAGILDFNNNIITNAVKCNFINNPDGSMRWFYPQSNSKPDYLQLYNSASLKAKVYKKLSSFLFFAGLKKQLASGSFVVLKKNTVEDLLPLHSNPVIRWAAFTGTIGENRKCIIALFDEKRCTNFMKIPMTDAATILVKQECRQLKMLALLDLKNLIIPKVKSHKNGIMLSNIQPEKITPDKGFAQVHLNALFELYSNTFAIKPVQEISVWKTIKPVLYKLKKSPEIKNEISLITVQRLVDNLIQLYEQLQEKGQWMVAFAHGDFTPWNMYSSKSALHLYDWELSVADMPVLFDVFHFYFQNGILVKHKDFSTIKKEIVSCMQKDAVVEFLKTHNLHWQKYYEFYLLYTLCYYLPRYLNQPVLHKQVHWLLQVWEAAIGDVVQTRYAKIMRMDL